MPNHYLLGKAGHWSRRKLLKLGLAGVGVTGGALALQRLGQTKPTVKVPPLPADSAIVGNNLSPMTILRDFDYGTVKRENGRTIREFRMTADTSTIDLNSAVTFNTWNVNGRVPGPTLRAQEGDR